MLNFKSKERLNFNPSQKDRFYTDYFQRFEKNRFPEPEVDLKKDITFFGNPTQTAAKLGYDQFFSYTKVLPLYDKRKERENRGAMVDKWSNIYQQEQPPKAVPATTSQWYGRRACYDYDRKMFARRNQIATFFFKSGATVIDPVARYTEEPADLRI